MILTDTDAQIQPGDALIAGLVLAAGSSRRFGRANKLLSAIHGEPLVHRSVRVFCEAALDPVIVVVGYEGDRIAKSVGDLGVQVVVNPRPAAGMSRSIVAGIEALPDSTEAAVLGVADQPRLRASTITQLASRFRETHAGIVAARYGGQLATPVLFHRSFFPLLLSLTGDSGAASIVRSTGSDVVWVDFDAGPGVDIDAPEDVRKFQREL